MEIVESVDLAEDIRNTPWIVEKIRTNKAYAQNVYAALCNIIWYKTTEFLPVLSGKNEWSCSWRWAGGFVAEIEDQGGDYMDWYCSGIKGSLSDEEFSNLTREEQEEYLHIKNNYQSEGYVAGEVSEDFAKIGWRWKEYEDDFV
jgi:hypothetical protein